MDYGTILLAFPVIVTATPYVAQVIKMTIEPLVDSKWPQDHDKIIRVMVGIIAAIIGAFWLVLHHLAPHVALDWIVTIAVLIAYALFGGSGSMIAYGLVNSWLHQSNPNLSKETKENRSPY